MSDHFEHVGYRYRPEPEKEWGAIHCPSDDQYRGSQRWAEELAARGWQVERLYRRCEDASE